MSKPANDQQAESIRHRLRNLLRERNEDMQFGLQRYAIERFLYRLGVSGVMNPTAWTTLRVSESLTSIVLPTELTWSNRLCGRSKIKSHTFADFTLGICFLRNRAAEKTNQLVQLSNTTTRSRLFVRTASHACR